MTDDDFKRLWSQALANTEGDTWLPIKEFGQLVEAQARSDALDILKKLNDGTYLDIAGEISEEGWEAIDAVLKDAND